MDEILRRTLRDPHSTPAACYIMLVRAGLDERDIFDEMIHAEKISSEVGVFQELQVSLGFKNLKTARDEVALEVLEAYEFPLPVVAVNGWEKSGRKYSCTVFVQPDPTLEDEDPDSIAMNFRVWFENSSPIPESDGHAS